MNNFITCNNCGSENNFYSLNCKKCASYLRPRIVNLDFWPLFWNMFESPSTTFKNIVHAEHKNFLTLILLLSAIKFSVNKNFVADLIYSGEYTANFSTPINILFFILLIISGSLLFKYAGQTFGLETRFKDNLACLTYSNTPTVLSLFVLTPIQIALFGFYWFTFNPSPVLIKPTAAYLLLSVDMIMVIWSMINLFVGFYTQSKSKVISLVFVIIIISAQFLFIIL